MKIQYIFNILKYYTQLTCVFIFSNADLNLSSLELLTLTFEALPDGPLSDPTICRHGHQHLCMLLSWCRLHASTTTPSLLLHPSQLPHRPCVFTGCLPGNIIQVKLITTCFIYVVCVQTLIFLFLPSHSLLIRIFKCRAYKKIYRLLYYLELL